MSTNITKLSVIEFEVDSFGLYAIEIDKEAWNNAYKIAGKVINNELPDPTKGANHYYDDSISVPYWAVDQISTLIITYINEYGKNASILFFKL